MQLRKIEGGEDYAQFAHKEGKMNDWDAVRDEITARTKVIAGDGKDVIDQSISLTIYSTSVVDLTLVDLPGLVNVQIAGQHQGIIQDVKNMVRGFVKRPNCLILVVIPANQDIANQGSLQLVREVDPEGMRTIGVVTKIDIMDRGCNALEMLEGKSFPLHHGYYGVKLRSKQDIDNKVTIQ